MRQVDHYRAADVLGQLPKVIFAEGDPLRPAIEAMLDWKERAKQESFESHLRNYFRLEGVAKLSEKDRDDSLMRQFRKLRARASAALNDYFAKVELAYCLEIPENLPGRPSRLDPALRNRIVIAPNRNFPSYKKLLLDHLPYLPDERPEVNFVVDFAQGEGLGSLAMRMNTILSTSGSRVQSTTSRLRIGSRTIVIGDSTKRADLANLYPSGLEPKGPIENPAMHGWKTVVVTVSQFRFLDQDAIITFCDIPDSEAAVGLMALLDDRSPNEFAEIVGLGPSDLLPERFQMRLQFSVKGGELQGRSKVLPGAEPLRKSTGKDDGRVTPAAQASLMI